LATATGAELRKWRGPVWQFEHWMKGGRPSDCDSWQTENDRRRSFSGQALVAHRKMGVARPAEKLQQNQ
jgi:hypothetical protein